MPNALFLKGKKEDMIYDTRRNGKSQTYPYNTDFDSH